MKFSCTRDNLYQGLSITSHITTKNVNLPILNNVLMRVDGASIRLTTTNLEIAVSCLVRGKIEQGGEFTIPSKLFFDYVSLLPNEKIDLEMADETLSIHCGNYMTKIKGIPSSDFPLIPSVSADRSFTIKAESLRSALSQILFSVATNESRPELTGVSMHFENQGAGKGKLVLAATDSYRLAEAHITLPEAPGEAPVSVIVPSRTLIELSRVLSVYKDEIDAPEAVTMSLSENQIVFAYGSTELISRTIEGNYPDYQQIIPKNFKTEAVIDREDMINAVKTASLFSKTGLFDVTLRFAPSPGALTVTAVDATRGENTASCAVDLTGESNEVTVNYRYVLDGLNAIRSDKVLFQMIDAANPCLVRPNDKDAGYLYVVMPIRQ